MTTVPIRRRRRLAALVTATLVSAGLATVPAVTLMPAQPAGAAAELILNEADLQFILSQIRIGEQTATRDAAQPPTVPAQGLPETPVPARTPITTPIAAIQAEWTRINATTVTEDQAATLPWGLRQTDGRNNNISDPARNNWGGSDEPFRRIVGANKWRNAGIDATTNVPCPPGPPNVGPVACGNYGDLSNNANPYEGRGAVRDYHARLVSNLIADQTSTNPAAVAASNRPVDVDGSIPVPNVAPIPVNAPYNGIFTLFGQYFDHGLDLVNKSSTEFVVIPLLPSDPLVKANRVNASNNFMMLNRTKLDANGDSTNAVTPWIDQNQTYTSHPAHQVFLRQYELRGGRPFATGKFLDGGRCSAPATATEHVCDIPDWGEVKAHALAMLGIELDDMNVHSVPLVLTDQYGRFIRNSAGFPMVLMQDAQGNRTWRSGTPGAPLKMVDRVNNVRAVGSGHAFLDDIAHGASPSENVDGSLKAYNAALLDTHFVTGDGRGNENIGLTSIHLVFHAEHNRLVNDVKRIVCLSADAAFRAEWGAVNGTNRTNPCTPGNPWDGERLFQASKFVNEMEYQHLIFDGFARKVQPLVKPFAAYNPNIQPAVTAEFAHAVYRYGHSQLNGTVMRQFGGPNGTVDNLSLLDAFLNPAKFKQNAAGGAITTAAESAGVVFQGMTNQIGNEIDEFTTNTLRNNLLGLPLDLPSLNITRARDAGTETLNGARQAFFEQTADESLRPYQNWLQFRQALRNDLSIVNFVAAYGKEHPASTTAGVKLQDLRANAGTDPDLITKLRARASLLLGVSGPADVNFLRGITPTSDPDNPTYFENGVNDIDLWMGGLAEKPQVMSSGMLGSTFDYVFKSQMEFLQNGDRFYYLARVAGTNLGVQLELNTWADMVMRNTTAEALPFDAFSYPTQTIASTSAQLVNTSERTPMGMLRLLAGPCDPTRHIVINGTANQDAFEAGCGNDTLRGLGADDYLRGGLGNDNIVGGAGDDMMYDSGGLTIFAGEAGHDYMVGGGADGDTYDGGAGNDIAITGLSGGVVTGAAGNDMLAGGNAADGLSGDDGDDWLEGGVDADLITGDAAAAAGLINNGAGRDVLLGGWDDDLMDGGESMDVGVDWDGVDSFLGGFGFDWMTYSTPTPAADKAADVDLAILAPPPLNVFPIDIVTEVEGLSGGSKADILRGDALTSFVPVPAVPGGLTDALTQADIGLISGLSTRVLANVPNAGAGWSTGNILLGGAGGDTIEGRGGNDVIHGDVNLRVYLSVPDTLAGINRVAIQPDPVTAGRVLVDSLLDLKPWLDNRTLRPTQITVVRLVEPNALDRGIDTAVFTNPEADYNINFNAGTGLLTVDDQSDPLAVLAVDGTDYLRGVERLVFGPVGAQDVLDVPTTPTVANVQQGDTTDTSLLVRWTTVAGQPNAGNNAYNVFLYTTPTGNGAAFRTCTPTQNNGTARSCTLSNLTPGTTYYVEVRARNNVGFSLPPAARIVRATTSAGLPVAPTGVTVNPAAPDAVTVAWNAVANPNGNNTVQSYTATAYLTNNTQTDNVVRGTCTATAPARTCDIQGLTANTTYWVSVTATTGGAGGGTGPASARVSGQTDPPTPPTSPQNVSLTAVPGTVTATWSAPASNGGAPITGYTASMYATNDPNGTAIASCTTATLTCGITVPGTVTPGATVWVAVRATNSGTQTSAASATASIATVVPGSPTAPTITLVTPVAGQVSVSWLAATAQGGTVTGYDVMASATQGGQAIVGATTCTAIAALTCTLTGLPAGSVYVKVEAISNTGLRNASWHGPVTIPQAAAPSAPRLAAPVWETNTRVTGQWRRPTDASGPTITRYEMRVWSTATGGVTPLATCQATPPAGAANNNLAVVSCSVTLNRATNPTVFVEVVGYAGNTPGTPSARRQAL